MVDRPGRRGTVSTTPRNQSLRRDFAGTPHRIEIVPSILSADVGRLAQQVKEAEAAGADRIQADVMDGHFVPNLTLGPLVLEAGRRATSLPIQTHPLHTPPRLFPH